MRLGLIYLRGKDFDRSKVIAPLAFGYLAAYLYEHLGFSDIVLEVERPEDILKQNPDIIGISSFTETFEDVIKVADYFKRVAPHIPLMVGGEHISALPSSLPRTIDFGFIGEGEATLTELMDLFLRRDVTPDNLYKINGLAYWHKDKLVLSPPREWIMDLDLIPPPNRAILSNADPKWQQAIFTARGCPYKCTFCASAKFWQKTRYHSIDRVIHEIEYIMKYYPQQTLIPINDDLFPLNKRRMKEVVSAIRAKGIHKKVGFVLNARASVFDEEIARLIAGMNGIVIGFGFESASDKILNFIKGRTSASQNQRALELCEKYGFAVVGNFMVGAPEEDWDDLAKTYWFIEKNKYRIWHPSVAQATPFPGTDFWDEASERNLVSDGFKHWNVLDLGFRPDESIYLNKYLPMEDYAPVYNQFRKFQAHPIHSKTEYVEMLSKRQYMDYLYKQVVEEIQPNQNILNISFESLAMVDGLETYDHAPLKQGEVIFPDESKGQYDIIVLNHVLEKAKNPQALLAAVFERLKPEGRVFCFCFNGQHLSILLSLLRGDWTPHLFSVYQHHSLHFFSETSLKAMLVTAGAQITMLNKLNFPNPELDDVFTRLQGPLLPLLDLNDLKSELSVFSYFISFQKIGASSEKKCLEKSVSVELPIFTT